MLALLIILFWGSLSLIECYRFARENHLGINNPVRFPDYHFWKVLLYIGVAGGYLLAYSIGKGWLHAPFFLQLIGGWLVGNFLFERIMDRLMQGVWFTDGDFHLLGREIPYPMWLQALTGLAGWVLLSIAFMSFLSS